MNMQYVFYSAEGIQHVLYFEGDDRSIITNCNIIAQPPFVRCERVAAGYATCIRCIVNKSPWEFR